MRRLALPALLLLAALVACGGSSNGVDTATGAQSPTAGASSGATGAPVGCPVTTTPVSPPASLASPPAVQAGSGAPPTTTQVSTLIKGNGPKVSSGDCVQVNYTGANFADGKVFDSSFGKGGGLQFSAGSHDLIEGFSDGVIGVPVGSRIKLVIPPSEGYGAQANGPIQANETLIFLVDVLTIKTG